MVAVVDWFIHRWRIGSVAAEVVMGMAVTCVVSVAVTVGVPGAVVVTEVALAAGVCTGVAAAT